MIPLASLTSTKQRLERCSENEPSDFQRKDCTARPFSAVLDTSSPCARRIERVLPLVTVAARFRVGELANSDGEMGAGKVLWLKRLALGRSADIALDPVFVYWQDDLNDRHGLQ